MSTCFQCNTSPPTLKPRSKWMSSAVSCCLMRISRSRNFDYRPNDSTSLRLAVIIFQNFLSHQRDFHPAQPPNLWFPAVSIMSWDSFALRCLFAEEKKTLKISRGEKIKQKNFTSGYKLKKVPQLEKCSSWFNDCLKLQLQLDLTYEYSGQKRTWKNEN
jgi:hypothetical protein